VNADAHHYRHDVPARSRTGTRTPNLLNTAVRIVLLDAAAQTVRIVVDSGALGELRDEFRRRIADRSPRWTDAHARDPGVTLLELFAYLGEGLLDRLPECPRRQVATRRP